MPFAVVCPVEVIFVPGVRGWFCCTGPGSDADWMDDREQISNNRPIRSNEQIIILIMKLTQRR